MKLSTSLVKHILAAAIATLSTSWLCGWSDCAASDDHQKRRTVQVKVVCCTRTILRGQTISMSSLAYKSVSRSACPADPIRNIVIARNRKATTKFLFGHIFTRRDFGLPQKSSPVKESDVLYALHDVPEGRVIKEADVGRKDWKGRDYPQGAMSDPDIVINRRARFGLQKRQMILDDDIGLRNLSKRNSQG